MISDIIVYLGVLPIDVTVVPRETLVEMRLIKGKWFAQGHKESYRVRFKMVFLYQIPWSCSAFSK